MSTKKFLLEEKDIPTAWYNIVADKVYGMGLDIDQ